MSSTRDAVAIRIGLRGGNTVAGYQLIVFDLDGVIINSEPLMRMSFDVACRECGLRRAPSIETFLACMGMPLAAIARKLDLPPSFVESYQRVSRERMDLVSVYDGARKFLDTARTGCRHAALMTGKDRKRTLLLLERMSLLSRFDAVVCGDDPVAGKPDPAGLLELMRRFSAKPSETVMLGDSAIDIQCSLAAGARSLGAGWGVGSRGELREAGAEIVFETPMDFHAWLVGISRRMVQARTGHAEAHLMKER